MTKLTIVTLNQPDITDFAKLRNSHLSRVKSDWVLFLDSDEKITPALKQAINHAMKNSYCNYQLKRQDIFLNKTLKFGETSKVRLTRLIRPGSGQWHGKVHEVFISKLPLKTLKPPLIHQRRLSINGFINRLNYYSDLRSQETKKFSLFQMLFFPPLKFIQNYFFRLGFLDGTPGLAMAFLMSFYSLTVRIKQYEKNT